MPSAGQIRTFDPARGDRHPGTTNGANMAKHRRKRHRRSWTSRRRGPGLRARRVTVNFVTIRQYTDLAPMFVGLPDGRCPCPHWGVMTKGRMTVTYADRVEVYEAGDAFYMTPGHMPAVDAGTEFASSAPPTCWPRPTPPSRRA